MKKKSFHIALFICIFSIFSAGAFAQAVPGGAADGGPDGEVSTMPSPIAFKRNNGNGTCGAYSEIRVMFDLIPEFMPAIEQIRYDGHIMPVMMVSIDTTPLRKKGYASYCFSANIPPAKKISVKFHYVQTNQTFWMHDNVIR